jgi:hypothetical protein
MIRSLIASLLVGLCAVGSADADIQLNKARPFLKKHCTRCHGATTQKGDLRFDRLGVDLKAIETLEVWQNILDQLNRREMPPKKEPQPTPAEMKPIVTMLSERLKFAYDKHHSTGGHTVIRRLNKGELRNTLRDLLYLQGEAYEPGYVARLVDNSGNGRVERTGNDPVGAFPDDEGVGGFTNIGQKLVMSDFLLKLTLGAAENALADATHLEPNPGGAPRRFAGDKISRNADARWPIPGASRKVHNDHELMVQGQEKHTFVSPHELRGGVGYGAKYKITIEASGHNQKHPWGEIVKTDPTKPHELTLAIANFRKGGFGGPTTQHLSKLTLPGDGNKHTLSVEVWMDPTWAPFISWNNGPRHKGLMVDALVKKYLPQAYTPRPDGKSKEQKQAHFKWPHQMAAALMKSGYKGPHIKVYSFTVEAMIDTWPPLSHAALYGSGPEEKANVGALMLAFAKRAYRRPVTSSEVAPYVALARKHMAGPLPMVNPPRGSKYSKEAWAKRLRAINGMQAGYAAIICSPNFLYIKEKGPQLDPYEIAARLSYFLWSSMPDDSLMTLARTGKLSSKTVIEQEVERMLQDPKAKAFTVGFPTAWLRLDKLGKMPPEKGGPFRWYHDRKAEPMYAEQVTRYFGDMVSGNETIEKFIDNDYTYTNSALAQWVYKIPKDKLPSGDHLRKWKHGDPRRGGIFTMPAVMTVSANGVDTSPVVRGVFVLENILGSPPSPPPPNVEPLPSDTRNAKTIREQLAMHRKHAACNSCHRKIDPMGFAMENFSPVGVWRDKYPRQRNNIDASTTLSTGQKVKDIVDFKKMLMAKKPQVTRCLTEKLLIYASGRLMEATDRGEIDKIVSSLRRSKGQGVRDLIKLVAQSNIVLNK